MQIPNTVVGFGLVILGSAILRPLRVRYLDQKVKNVSIDFSKETILRFAPWNYIYPLGYFGACVMFAVAIYQGSPHPETIAIDTIACVVCLICGIYMFKTQRNGRVTIFDGTLTYEEGSDRFVIQANEVLGYLSKGFVFWVKLKSEEQFIKIPATFEHSEIILAFLNKATFKN